MGAEGSLNAVLMVYCDQWEALDEGKEALHGIKTWRLICI